MILLLLRLGRKIRSERALFCNFLKPKEGMKKTFEMVLERFAKMATYTVGHLYVKQEPEMKCIDGQLVTVDKRYLCDTLEPKRRNLKKEKKVPGRTAIPEGRYRVLITKSYRFQRWLPILLDVPGFSGVRLHSGNYPSDSQGCILTGFNRKKGMVVNSRSALQMVMLEITAAIDRGEEVWITM